MPDEGIDRRDYGKLEAKVEQLAKEVADLTTIIQEIRDTMNEARGGWRMIALIAGISSTLGSVGTWVASHVQFVR